MLINEVKNLSKSLLNISFCQFLIDISDNSNSNWWLFFANLLRLAKGHIIDGAKFNFLEIFILHVFK